MRIGEVNDKNYSIFMNFLSTISGKKTYTDNSLENLQEAFSNIGKCGGRTALDDLLSGNLKNSYGVTGMDITGKKGWQKEIPISESMVKQVIAEVKREFYEHGGMSGSNAAEQDAYFDKVHAYIKNTDEKDRLAASWSIGQIDLKIAKTVAAKVKEKVPSWTPGNPISSKVLDEIFEEEDFLSQYKNTSASIKYKGLDKTV